MDGSQMPEAQALVVDMVTLSSVADEPAALMFTPYPPVVVRVASLMVAEPPLSPELATSVTASLAEVMEPPCMDTAALSTRMPPEPVETRSVSWIHRVEPTPRTDSVAPLPLVAVTSTSSARPPLTTLTALAEAPSALMSRDFAVAMLVPPSTYSPEAPVPVALTLPPSRATLPPESACAP
ncbi:hypothetical protein D3C87_1351780 [compost metagenome]